jgi:hypothetical protein
MTIPPFFTNRHITARKKIIAKFIVNDRVVTSPEDKLRAALDFYDALIGSAEQRDFTLDFLSLGVQQHDLSELEVPFTEEEVWATIREIPLDKAPGPDGFTGRFYKVCWNSIKDDVLAALLAVQRDSIGQSSMFSISGLSTPLSSLLCLKRLKPYMSRISGLLV